MHDFLRVHKVYTLSMKRSGGAGHGVWFPAPSTSPTIFSFPYTILYLYTYILISVFYTTRSFLLVTLWKQTYWFDCLVVSHLIESHCVVSHCIWLHLLVDLPLVKSPNATITPTVMIYTSAANKNNLLAWFLNMTCLFWFI